MSRRRGLVLGAGGVLGAAWTIAALSALEQCEGFDARGCDAIVGTSAGAVIAALLGAGVSVENLLRHQQGSGLTTGPLAGYAYDYDGATGGALPAMPRFGIGSKALLRRAILEPHHLTPMALLASVLPEGRGSLGSVPNLVDAVVPAGEWSAHPRLWVVAMDYDSGQRVAFGQARSPVASLADAVVASCSIPGWYAPVTIEGRRYVDGGTYSATSVDLLAGADLDEVWVLAPMASFQYDSPASLAARVERGYRRRVTRRMLREAAEVRAAGVTVAALGPRRADLEAMGANLMDPSRRSRVLETSLQTSTEALRQARAGDLSWSG